MSTLVTKPNLDNPDDCYAALLRAHEGLDEAGTNAMNARLILILANHIGDLAVWEEALMMARSADRATVGDATGDDPTKR